MSKNSNLKKKIGEKNYKFLSRNFSDDFLKENLSELFGLLTDIRYISDKQLPLLKNLLNSRLEKPLETKTITKTAKELLDEAGFVLFDNINYKKDYLQFKKYFKENELLCKFSSYDATDRYSKVFWILRKDIDQIQRPENPNRQDEYSTSCMSIGISKDKKNVLQITSRYNHTVSSCDNTYNSNLDNIVEGLTEAFNKDYNLSLKQNQNDIEFDNFYLYNNKYYHYHYEINGRKYGDNTIDSVLYNSDYCLIFDNFILNLKNKKIKTVDETPDFFVNYINKKLENGKIKVSKNQVEFLDINNNSTLIELENNQIISLTDLNIEIIGHRFLYYNKNLKKLNLPELKSIGNYFLYYNENLTELNLPNLKTVGYCFLYKNKNLTELNLPELETVGNCFLNHNKNLTELSLPNLKTLNHSFLHFNVNLTKLNLPELKSVGNDFLYCNESLTKLNLPKLKSIGGYFLYHNKNLIEFKKRFIKK